MGRLFLSPQGTLRLMRIRCDNKNDMKQIRTSLAFLLGGIVVGFFLGWLISSSMRQSSIPHPVGSSDTTTIKALSESEHVWYWQAVVTGVVTAIEGKTIIVTTPDGAVVRAVADEDTQYIVGNENGSRAYSDGDIRVGDNTRIYVDETQGNAVRLIAIHGFGSESPNPPR